MTETNAIEAKRKELERLIDEVDRLVERDIAEEITGRHILNQQIVKLEKELGILEKPKTTSGSTKTRRVPRTPPRRIIHGSSHFYRSHTQPELAEPIPLDDENPYPDSTAGTFIHMLGPNKRLLTLVGARNLTFPLEMWEGLTEGEILAAYVSKGTLSWRPSDLLKFRDDYRGMPGFLMMDIYKKATEEFPEGELEKIDGVSPREKELDLYERLKTTIPTAAKKEFARYFFTIINDFHGAYREAATLGREKVTREIYDVVTSYQQSSKQSTQ